MYHYSSAMATWHESQQRDAPTIRRDSSPREKLHSIVNTEIGNTLRDLLVRDRVEVMLSLSKLPPMNQIIMIFERCIKA